MMENETMGRIDMRGLVIKLREISEYTSLNKKKLKCNYCNKDATYAVDVKELFSGMNIGKPQNSFCIFNECAAYELRKAADNIDDDIMMNENDTIEGDS